MKRRPLSGIENGEAVFYCPNRLMDSVHNGLTKSAGVLYITIAGECSKKKSYSMNLKNKELAEKTGISESTVIRALKDLEKEHFIERDYSRHIRVIKLLDY